MILLWLWSYLPRPEWLVYQGQGHVSRHVERDCRGKGKLQSSLSPFFPQVYLSQQPSPPPLLTFCFCSGPSTSDLAQPGAATTSPCPGWGQAGLPLLLNSPIWNRTAAEGYGVWAGSVGQVWEEAWVGVGASCRWEQEVGGQGSQAQARGRWH